MKFLSFLNKTVPTILLKKNVEIYTQNTYHTKVDEIFWKVIFLRQLLKIALQVICGILLERFLLSFD